MGAVFVDLDRTLLRRASGPVLNAALVPEGVVPANRSLPGERALYGLYDRLGETLPAMALARAAALVARGRSQEAVRRAGERAVTDLAALVSPYAPGVLAAFRSAGHRLVLATTTPSDLVRP
ncbi:MAG: haloacid dehalogenase-like hydrolase, partial [Acidimicrobiales bacterium]